MIPELVRRVRMMHPPSRAVTTPCACFVALVLAVALASAGPRSATRAPAGRDAQHAEQFIARVESLRIAARIPGLSVVVLRDTSVVLARGLGYADLELRISATPETPYNIASVAKTMSAVVALRLVELKQLDLDRRMSSFEGFDEFCRASRERGGIFFGDYTCDSTLTLRHVMSMSANGTPGTRFWYNPVSNSWASRPMAQVSKTPFSELVAKYVFEPAGMTRSARIHRALPLRADLAGVLAKPYALDSANVVVASSPPPPQGDGAAGGVISTAMDIARFDIALTNGKLLTRASRTLMWTPTRTPGGTTLPYGIGWFVTDVNGERLLWHTGLWEGAYSALYLKAPARHLTLVLLANSDGLRWEGRLDEAELLRSPFARAFLEEFGPPRRLP